MVQGSCNKRIRCLLLCLILLAVLPSQTLIQAEDALVSTGQDPLPAFPGAEGFGSGSVGGRGGRVIKVTNLNPSGPGSLQEACEAEGPRLVVFEVSGVIHGDITITNPYITIAGQTAPGAGITIEGMLSSYGDVHDVIIRFLRIRPRRFYGDTGDALQMTGTYNVIIDHLSLSWSTDEVVGIIKTHEWTIQWCTIEESDLEGHDNGKHNYGLLAAYSDTGNISIHHSLFAHHRKRLPSVTPYVEGKPGDFRNNVVYDFDTGFTHDGHVPVAPLNFIANYYKKGPSVYQIYPWSLISEGQYYIAGNYIADYGYIGDPRDEDFTAPNWVRYTNIGEKLEVPAPVPLMTTHTAEEAYQLVMSHAGGLPRDQVTIRTVEEVIHGTGQWGRNAPLEPTDAWFLEGLQPLDPPLDSDDDGMPDYWEDAHGLNKHDPSDHSSLMPSGYTAIEECINELAENLIQAASPMKGDINLDGQVDLSDVQMCINVILNLEKAPDVIGRSDLNLDGKVNSLDAQEIVNISLED